MQMVLWRIMRMSLRVFLQRRSLLFIIVLSGLSVLAAVSGENFIALAIGVNQTGTSTTTIGTSISTSLSQQQQLINQPFTVLSTTGTNLQCELWNFTFTGNQGQYVSGNLTSDSPVGFYIVQETSYQNWLKQGSCGSATDTIASQQFTVSYSFNAALPNSGRWVIVLINSSSTRNADGSIAAYVASEAYTVTQVMLSTITTTGMTETTPTASTGVPGFPVESILVGVTVGLIAILVLRFRRRA
jgi:hypothetical protein